MDFKNALKLIFILLIIQNGFFYIDLIMKGSNDTIFQAVMYFDLFCYFLLAVFLVLQGLSTNKTLFTVSGLSFFVWVGTTIIWRSQLNFFSTVTSSSNSSSISNTVNSVYIFYLIAGIAFTIGIYLLSRDMYQSDRRNMIIINAYGVVNLISVIFTI